MNKTAVFCLGTLVLAGCGGGGPPAPGTGQRVTTGPTPFTQELAREYGNLVDSLGRLEITDREFFSEKQQAAAADEPIDAVLLSDWHLPDFAVPELREARYRLVNALDRNGRTALPTQAAVAQVSFDCWVEAREDDWDPDAVIPCRDQFYAALAELEARLQEAPPAPILAGPVYFVFFDFDRSEITPAAQQIISQVAQAYQAGEIASIDVLGHADRSGPNAYNQTLGQRRADAVRAALTALGVPATAITTASAGEEDPLIQTPDGVREPSNRRAEIRFF